VIGFFLLLMKKPKPWTDRKRIKARLEELNEVEVGEDLFGEQACS